MSSKQELICWKSRRMRSKSGTPPPLGALAHLGGSHKKWKGTGDLGAGSLIRWGYSWYKRNRKNKNWQGQKNEKLPKLQEIHAWKLQIQITTEIRLPKFAVDCSKSDKIQESRPNSRFPTKVSHLQIMCTLFCNQQDMFQNCLFFPSLPALFPFTTLQFSECSGAGWPEMASSAHEQRWEIR